MEAQTPKPVFSERLTFQVTPEVKARLLEMADQRYGGDRQALGRAALEGWLQREETRRSYEARILETLIELRDEAARKRDTSNILKGLDFVREDFAYGPEINDILDTVKKLSEDTIMRNQLLDRLLEQLGVNPKP